MTEEQRLTTQIIDVSSPIKGTIFLKLASKVTDENAIISLKQIQNSQFQNACPSFQAAATAAFENHVEKSYGTESKSKLKTEFDKDRQGMEGERKTNSTYEQAGTNELNKLKLLAAQIQFKKASKLTTHGHRPYLKRLMTEIARKEWFPASRTALKSLNSTAIFITNFALGRFELCYPDIIKIQENIDKGPLGLVSRHEIALLAAYSSLATATPDFVHTNILPLLIHNLVFSSKAPLFKICELFSKSDFFSVLNNLNIEKDLQYSLYGSHVIDDLQNAIILNILHKIALPIAHAKFSYFSEILSLAEDQVRDKLFLLIEDGKLLGKLDLIDNCYIGGVRTPQDVESEFLIARVLSLSKKTEALVWKEEFNHKPLPEAIKNFSFNYPGGGGFNQFGGMGGGGFNQFGGMGGGGFNQPWIEGGGFNQFGKGQTIQLNEMEMEDDDEHERRAGFPH